MIVNKKGIIARIKYLKTVIDSRYFGPYTKVIIGAAKNEIKIMEMATPVTSSNNFLL